MYRDYLLHNLEVYVVGTYMCGLLETFSDHQKLVPRQNGYHGLAFPSTRGTMQGGLVSPTIFNVVVDNVIWTWLSMTVEEQRLDHNGLVEAVRRCLGFSYTDNGMIGFRDPD